MLQTFKYPSWGLSGHSCEVHSLFQLHVVVIDDRPALGSMHHHSLQTDLICNKDSDSAAQSLLFRHTTYSHFETLCNIHHNLTHTLRTISHSEIHCGLCNATSNNTALPVWSTWGAVPVGTLIALNTCLQATEIQKHWQLLLKYCSLDSWHVVPVMYLSATERRCSSFRQSLSCAGGQIVQPTLKWIT